MSDDAREVLAALQAAIDSRNVEQLTPLFEQSAVLIGTSGDGRDRDGVVRYLTAVAEGEAFRWEWDDVVTFHHDGDSLGAAAFGEIVAGDLRAPIRVTIMAVRTPDGWRLRQFHGSIPWGFGG